MQVLPPLLSSSPRLPAPNPALNKFSVSKLVCDSSGYRCFNRNRRCSALSANVWFLSMPETRPQCDFVLGAPAFLLHICIDASIWSASSTASCSEFMLRLSSTPSGRVAKYELGISISARIFAFIAMAALCT